MIVYEAEKQAGLADILLDPAKSCISFASVAEPLNDIDLDKLSVSLANLKSLASIAKAQIGDKDLFPLKTILVTTSWNKNDDVFCKEEVWAARHTPEDKPFNLGHEEQNIIGHITDDYCIDEKFNVIPDSMSVDLLPDKFHILTSAVIYRALADEDRKEQIEKIIKEISQGKWFVSMECYFNGFDYAVQGPDATAKVIARCKDSAFLTQHLRAYGGKGEYDGYKVGRLMRNICFSGKGLVEKPANPESVILTERNSKAFSFANQLLDISSLNKSKGEQKMSEAQDNKAVEKLEKQLETSKANEEKVEAKVKELETKIAELEKSNKTLAEEKDVASKKLDEVSKELNDTKASIRLNTRISALVEAGLEKTEAEAKAKKFDGVSDEIFAEIVEMTEAAGKKMDDSKTDEDEKNKKGKKKPPYTDKTADAASDDDDDMNADEEDKKKVKKDKKTKEDVSKTKKKAGAARMNLKNEDEYDSGGIENENDSNESDVGKTDDVAKVKKALSEEEAEVEDEYEEESAADLEVDDEDLSNAESEELDDETSKVVAHIADYFSDSFGKKNKNKE